MEYKLLMDLRINKVNLKAGHIVSIKFTLGSDKLMITCGYGINVLISTELFEKAFERIK